MSTNRMIRMIRLLESLAPMEWLALSDLCADHEVDRRTLRRDLILLEQLGMTIDREGHSVRLTRKGRQQLRGLMLARA